MIRQKTRMWNTFICALVLSALQSSWMTVKVKKWKSLSHARLFATPWTVVHGILQARILEWVATPSSKESSQPREELRSPALQTASAPTEPKGKPSCTTVIHQLGPLKANHRTQISKEGQKPGAEADSTSNKAKKNEWQKQCSGICLYKNIKPAKEQGCPSLS